ncbi:MAG: hypothetical protein ACREGE_01280 [Candidatus Microsaccharimonas sp.]
MNEFEQVGLNYRNWEGATADELGYLKRDGIYENSAKGPAGMHVERHFVEPLGNGQYINVFNADARPLNTSGERIGPTILKFQSHNYRIDELSERKTQIHAHQAGARVLDIELPGVTMDYQDPKNTKGGFMTPLQFAQSFSGDFDALAHAQLKAADQVVAFKDGDEIQAYGESLGAYSAVALARVLARGRFEKQLHISKMTLVEPVNGTANRSIMNQLKMSTERLAKIEHYRRLVYLTENTTIGHPVTMFEMLNDQTAHIDTALKSRIGQAVAAAASGAGLRKGLEGALWGALANRSEIGPRLHEADITIAHGRESSVTLAKDLSNLADVARERGVTVRLVEFGSSKENMMPAGHSQLDSLGRMAEAALYMARR